MALVNIISRPNLGTRWFYRSRRQYISGGILWWFAAAGHSGASVSNDKFFARSYRWDEVGRAGQLRF